MCCVVRGLLRDIQGFEIDNNWLLRIAHDDPLRWNVGRGIDLLMRHKGWNIDEIARFHVLLELHVIAPAYLATTGNDVNHRLNFAMMVSAARGIRRDNSHTGPDANRTCQFAGDSGDALHSRRLWCVGVELVRSHHAYADGLLPGFAIAHRCPPHLLHWRTTNKFDFVAVGVVNVHGTAGEDGMFAVAGRITSLNKCVTLHVEFLFGQFQRHVVKLVAGRFRLDPVRLGDKHDHLWNTGVALADSQEDIGQGWG